MTRSDPNTPGVPTQPSLAQRQAEEAQELADNVLGLLIALSRHTNGERLALLQRVTLALTERVAERTRNTGGKKQAAAFSAALVQAAYYNNGNNGNK